MCIKICVFSDAREIMDTGGLEAKNENTFCCNCSQRALDGYKSYACYRLCFILVLNYLHKKLCIHFGFSRDNQDYNWSCGKHRKPLRAGHAEETSSLTRDKKISPCGILLPFPHKKLLLKTINSHFLYLCWSDVNWLYLLQVYKLKRTPVILSILW